MSDFDEDQESIFITFAGQTVQEETESSCKHLMAGQLSYDLSGGSASSHAYF